jgi:hypothetical protein
MKIITLPKLLFLFVFLNCFFISYAQDFASIRPTLTANPTSELICSSSNDPVVCNIIQNDQFSNSATNTTNPFPYGQVPNWVETHGSPALSNFFTPPGAPPAGIAAYTSLYSWYQGTTTEGEGIAQKITPLLEGNSYAMSFFKKLAGTGLDNMGKFYVILLHCDDYESIHTYPSYTIPSIPRNSQVIYCENTVANTSWQQIFSCFRALDDYDLVWIFPVQDLPTETLSGLSGVDFSGLEIINTTSFSAGPTPSPTLTSPVVNIGPVTPNCGLRNAVFTWYGPNGQITLADANQKTSVDASDSLQRGEWTLKMNVLGISKGLNNPCKELCNISASVSVPSARKDLPFIMDCNRPIPATCNLIVNSGLSSTCYGSDPFKDNCVNGWDYGFSTPELNTFWGPLNANNNTANMWAYSSDGIYSLARAEGIVTAIPRLIPGHTYSFSFFKAGFPQVQNLTPFLDEFNIYLITCADYQQMEPISASNSVIPPPPNGAQQIYCETNISNTNLQRVSICFTASNDYNMLWIFPRQWTMGAQQWWLGFAQPELIDVTGFSAGPDPAVNYPTCTATIGPSTPNCGPTGAVYTWYPPNGGTPIVAGPSQQININTALPANVGTWTLRMSVPNTVITNNTCSGSDVIEDEVLIRACTACAVNVTPAGPIDYYIPNDYSVIGGFTLTSTTPTGNQWYRNGVAISGATGQTHTIPRGYSHPTTTETYTCIANGCTSNVVTVNFKHYGYGNYGEQSFDFGAKIFPPGGSRYYCINTNNNPIQQFNQGTLADYYWNVITTPSEGTPYISITSGSTGLHSNLAQINIGTPVLSNPPYFTNYDFIQGVSDLNGVQKIIDFEFEVTPPFHSPGFFSTCASQNVDIKASHYLYYNRAPETTLFDWEEYDFGPNSTIVSPNPTLYPVPSDPTNINKIRIPGNNVFSGSVLVRFSANSQIKRNFYYNSPVGGCYKEVVDITVNTGCRTGTNDEISLILYPNPSTNEVIFKAIEKNTLINSIEVRDKLNSPVFRLFNKSANQLTLNISTLKTGVYFCHIQTTNGSYVKKLVIQK